MSFKREKHTTQFDCSDVTWEVEDTKRNNVVRITLKCDGRFNLIKIWLSLRMICEKLDTQMGYMESTDESVKN